ncbi:hypothetical protein KEM54_000296 [Ascosphaera aggregata]|nr:hypothetical protein KEM54_000296 [Ascosphaera aggregata]
MASIALPKVDMLSDIADYSLTVQPYYSHLCALPSRLFAAGFDFENLKDVYLTTNPLMSAAALALSTAPIFLIISEVNRNYSQVDRCWSILPLLFNAHYALWAYANGLPTFTLRAIVAVRLSYNYWRKGGFQKGSEDYRWAIVQKRLNSRFLFFVLNLTFISTLQPVLLFLITTPTYIMTLHSTLPDQHFELYDFTIIEILLITLFIEALADNQQWNFQSAKHEYKKTGRVPAQCKPQFTPEDFDRGFNIHGLFSWCRHPNFAAEQAVWIIFHQWTLLKARVFFNWAGIGAFCYVLLFQASTRLTESITASKYPEYSEYQKVVGMFIPKFTVNTSESSEVAQDLRKRQ